MKLYDCYFFCNPPLIKVFTINKNLINHKHWVLFWLRKLIWWFREYDIVYCDFHRVRTHEDRRLDGWIECSKRSQNTIPKVAKSILLIELRVVHKEMRIVGLSWCSLFAHPATSDMGSFHATSLCVKSNC